MQLVYNEEGILRQVSSHLALELYPDAIQLIIPMDIEVQDALDWIDFSLFSYSIEILKACTDPKQGLVIISLRKK